MTITTELAQRMRKLSAEIVENLVDCDGADDEAVEQYLKWTQETLGAFVRDSLEAKDKQIVNLTAERDALRESEMGDARHSNTRAAADIYFQLVEECDIPAGGSLVEYVDDMRQRIAELETRTEKQPVGNQLTEYCAECSEIVASWPDWKKQGSDSYAAITPPAPAPVTVNLPEPVSVLHRRDYLSAHTAIYAYPAAELNAALATQGIKIEEGE